ncbi:hypothetical protein [Kineosporia sp. NBRC 101731]|uniref:hypothetical protein n=1 Tax=Kineosporia sp. NBRC 101731 TaxID=3032199 RepID=UPI0024A2C3E3|nr:hypothetical protein [Kineosporia sp. NBRC 101731]GLY27141.1 hypothetical protein Kisp02_05060 [Kineosporia sp. NBRC 101731]
MSSSALRRQRFLVVLLATVLILTALLSLTWVNERIDQPVEPTAAPAEPWTSLFSTPVSSEPPSDHDYAGDLARSAMEAAFTATSVHVEADTVGYGQHLRYDLSIDRNGQALGRISNTEGGETRVILQGDTGYVQYGENLPPQEPGTPGWLTGQWISITRNDQTEEIFAATQMPLLVDDVLDLPDVDAPWRTYEHKTLDGLPTVALGLEGGERRTYVRTDGARQVLLHREEDFRAIYSLWNDPLVLEAPPHPITWEESTGQAPPLSA